ncbi:MAG TPA: glycosyltransferase 87 family protein [Flexivirga sp.]|uniref:glycosyltransferase 87 family protein n=1 Tax=Flexivirga sp. TaxID=1962927 RepID=UPI002CB45679|nr:glycosyltransferase 87 family protein [Flexivirga sp.]HWC24602.1 glycosyltransferase 87 family protein [Flexivirga sp.]
MQPPGLVVEPAAVDVVIPESARRAGRQRRRLRVAGALVFAVALVVRLGVILRKGGIHGILGYDCGVYFAGADALLHGRLPYRDFTMVHPPGITLALTPFAALTHVMSDWHAFVVATLAFCFMGAVNAVLVMLVCRRLGIALRGAALAGLCYAAWFGSISAEFQVKLEPLGNLLLLCGLLALLRDQRRATRWSTVLAGAVVGLPMAVKIWWAVPVLLIVAWHGVCRRSVRAAGQALLGAAAGVTAVCLPFFLADPSGMWQSVITGQLGRERKVSIVDRLAELSTVPEMLKHVTARQQQMSAIFFVVFVCATVAFAWKGTRRARFLVVVTMVQLGVLLAAPSWFLYYCDYLAVGLAVTVGAAAVAVRREHMVRTPAVAFTAALLAVTGVVTVTGLRAILPYGGAGTLTRAVRGERCVMSNSPTVLIRVDALSRGLADGCPNWIDSSGRLMGPDNPRALQAEHRTWEGVLAQYLRSGDAAILWQPKGRRYLPQVRSELAQDGVIAQAGGHVVYRGQAHS